MQANCSLLCLLSDLSFSRKFFHKLSIDFGAKYFPLVGVWKQIKKMGLSSFHSAAAEGVFPMLVMNTVLSVVLLKNMLRSMLQAVGASGNPRGMEEDPDCCPENGRERRISITQFKSLCRNSGGFGAIGGSGSATTECCVCLCKFQADEEVSELSCKHFFHKDCLEKWFDNRQNTCPLCRSMD